MSKPSLSLSLLRTRMAMLWERLYAGLVPILIVFFVFTGLALFGVFESLPGWLHLLALLNFIGLIIWATIVAEPHLMVPRAEEVRHRLEVDSGLPPGRIADLKDHPFGDDDSSPLWHAHQDQLLARLGNLTPGRPRAVIDRTDPYALRIPALLLALIGLLVAGPAAQQRLAGAVVPSFGDRTQVTADVWIEPPDYTRQPPRFLVRGSPLTAHDGSIIEVPEGSILRVRASRASAKLPKIDITLPEPITTEEPDSNTPGTQIAQLTKSGHVSLRVGRDRMSFPVEVVADASPSVTLIGQPSVDGGVRTRLTLSFEDDYGIADGEVELRLAADLGRSPDAPPIPDPVGPSRIDAPALRGEPGTRDVALDLTDHPWAGLPALLRVRVTDGAGQTAQSRTVTFTLPERTFYNPLSRAIIEQRQNLALAPQSWQRSLQILDALTLSPELFATDANEYLLLRTAYHDVDAGRGRNVSDLVENFWPLAIALEDEGLTLARQRLQAAQEALRQALANGAPPEEIDQLVEELRQAMNDYLAALAASGDALAEENSNREVMEGQDLNDLLDEIARLRRQGDSAEARERLAQLEQLLQDMRITQGGEGQQSGNGQPNPTGSEGEGAAGDGEGNTLGEAGDLIDQQRRLSDDTFSARRGDRSQEGLSETQQELADAARELSDDASSEESAGAGSFTEAARMMDGAARALERGDLFGAAQAQERAMGYLREGAISLAEEALSAEENRNGETGSAEGQGNTAGQAANRDPLGRAYQGVENTGIEIPDLSDPERVRELTRSLRERLRDPNLPLEDRQYLERLLRRF